MANNYEYYFNITYLKEHAVLRCKVPYDVEYSIKRNLPNIIVLGKGLEKITRKILDIEKQLPSGEIKISSIKDEVTSGEIIPKTTLSRLCNMLNKEKGEEIFKIIESLD